VRTGIWNPDSQDSLGRRRHVTSPSTCDESWCDSQDYNPINHNFKTCLPGKIFAEKPPTVFPEKNSQNFLSGIRAANFDREKIQTPDIFLSKNSGVTLHPATLLCLPGKFRCFTSPDFKLFSSVIRRGKTSAVIILLRR
jgi:hypothetical protein